MVGGSGSASLVLEQPHPPPPPRSVKNNWPFIGLSRQTGGFEGVLSLSGVCSTNRQAERTLIGIEVHTRQRTPTHKGFANLGGTRLEGITLRGGVFVTVMGLQSRQVEFCKRGL